MLDANTFTDKNVISYLNDNIINLKLDASTDYGQNLFFEFQGSGYPMLLFLDNERNEIDRFYGYYEPEEFLNKIKNIVSGENTFPNLLVQYNNGDNSAETLSLLAEKYADRGQDSIAVNLYSKVLKSKNVPYDVFHKAKYYINLKLLWNHDNLSIENYISDNPASPFVLDAVNQLLAYYKHNDQSEEELIIFSKYLNQFSDNAWFLNQYAWRMTELNMNLEDALEKINLALNIFKESDQGISNVIDTKAEILWKLDRLDEAIVEIEKAILMDPENDYYKNQKNKFLTN